MLEQWKFKYYPSVKILVAGAAILSLTACSTTPKVYVDHDAKQDFSTYKTFAWAKTPPGAVSGDYPVSPMVQQTITSAIRDDLTAQGYVFQNDVNSADFAVAYTVGARDKMNVDAYPSTFYNAYDSWGWGYPYYPAFGRMGPSMTGSTMMDYSTYTTIEGSLGVDIYDVKTKRPVWHANSSKRLSSQPTGDSDKVRKVVANMIAEFPNGE